jgi:hypothetical protein
MSKRKAYILIGLEKMPWGDTYTHDEAYTNKEEAIEKANHLSNDDWEYEIHEVVLHDNTGESE